MYEAFHIQICERQKKRERERRLHNIRSESMCMAMENE